MILGIGIDIIDNRRIKKIISRYGSRFLERCFSKNELINASYKLNDYSFIAKRYAAKEAFTKALGTGFTRGVVWKDIEIYNNSYGKPYIKLNNNTLNMLNKQNRNYKIEISLSDEKDYSIANVIIFKNEK